MCEGLGKIEEREPLINLIYRSKPLYYPVRQWSPREQEFKRAAIEMLLTSIFIDPSISPWAACNVFVKNKDSYMPVSFDLNGLNALIVSETYRMEYLHATMDFTASKTLLSTFDFKDKISSWMKDFTSILTVFGLWKYLRLPHELKTSPSLFQGIIQHVLGDRRGRNVWAFMDDVNLRPTKLDEHLMSVDSDSKTFFEAGASVKLTKCSFGVQSV